MVSSLFVRFLNSQSYDHAQPPCTTSTLLNKAIFSMLLSSQAMRLREGHVHLTTEVAFLLNETEQMCFRLSNIM